MSKAYRFKGPILAALMIGLAGSGISACGESMDHMAPANAAAGQAFLAKTAKETGVKSLSGGLLYKVIASGDQNSPQAGPTDLVKVNYEGKLIDGTVFDSSFKRGVPAAFNLDGVVKAWQIAVPHMHKGDVWVIYVPAELGYGDRGAGPIPPGSVLIIKIQLIDVMGK